MDVVTPDADRERRLLLASDGAMSVADAAAFVGVSDSLLYEYMSAGTLPFSKVGRRTVIPRRALQELIAARMTVVEG